MIKGIFLAALTAILINSAALASDSYNLPPYLPAYEPKTVDERGMWMAADDYEKALKTSERVIDDENLTNYLHSILCSSVGQDRCRGVRIYVADIPGFNASMVPNGAMAVWTGLLLRARSEAEVAAVLGHEFAHFELRHSLQGFQARRKGSDLLAWAMVLGGMTGTNTQDLTVSIVGSMYRFDQSMEKEADLLGLRFLAKSPYPSRAASEVWQHLMEEADATLYGRNLKKRHKYQAGFFDTHPTDLNRAEYLLDASLKFSDSGNAETKRYYDSLKPYLPRLLASQVRLNDLHGTDYILNGIAMTTGWTGELLEARAEMYATRGEPRDLVTATTLYLNAIDAGFRKPTTVRGLGLSLVKSGKRSEGARYLTEYLEMMPEASDARVIRLYLPKPENQ